MSGQAKEFDKAELDSMEMRSTINDVIEMSKAELKGHIAVTVLPALITQFGFEPKRHVKMAFEYADAFIAEIEKRDNE